MKTPIITGLICTVICAPLSVTATESTCRITDRGESAQTVDAIPLPRRKGPRTRTSGRVPHVQIDEYVREDLSRELHRLASNLPGVTQRASVVSLPGATGLWLNNALPIIHPEVIVSGREFAHIHPDSSLHAALPVDRAAELTQKGWGENHPWAGRKEGFGGFVMIFSPRSIDELSVVVQLVTESYNYVTGEHFHVSNC